MQPRPACSKQRRIRAAERKVRSLSLARSSGATEDTTRSRPREAHRRRERDGLGVRSRGPSPPGVVRWFGNRSTRFGRCTPLAAERRVPRVAAASCRHQVARGGVGGPAARSRASTFSVSPGSCRPPRRPRLILGVEDHRVAFLGSQLVDHPIDLLHIDGRARPRASAPAAVAPASAADTPPPSYEYLSVVSPSPAARVILPACCSRR